MAPRPFTPPADLAAHPPAPTGLGAAGERTRRPGHCLARLVATARSAPPAPAPATASEGSGAGTPLPDDVRARMERAFRQDFSAVRIHQGPRARSLRALAFTRGADIHFAPGTYRPRTPRGLRLLGHELTHVVQQRAGRASMRPQRFGGGEVSRLEAEADRAADRVARGAGVSVRGAAPPGAVQKDGWDDDEIYQAPDKVFGPSRGAVTYGGVAGKLEKNPKSKVDPRFAMTMSAMISNVAHPKSLEDQPGPNEPNLEEWEGFQKFYPRWAGRKPSRGNNPDPGFKKASKAAIDYTTEELGGRIHFVPGKLNLAEAANKEIDQGTTAADELRYIYRNRERLGTSVRFYDNLGKSQRAPWEHPGTREAWAEYEERRKKKKEQVNQ